MRTNHKRKLVLRHAFSGIFIFLFILPEFSKLLGDEYLWPTDASKAITSTFAEYRPGRFHAGIDIKTWGRTGYNIYAIRDGYISRIRVSPYGYGRALYLTLDTGETVVYGHLEGFNKEIEDYVWTEQLKRGKYGVQLFFNSDKFKYKQGDYLGKTGQTGVGYPHLHFEMRNPSGEPFNPLSKGYIVEDFSEPVITKVSLIPLNANSSINNDCKPIILRTKYLRKGHYVIEKPVSVSSLVGFGVSAYDVMDNITNKFGTYKNRLYIDDQLVFSSIYKKFSYAENNLAFLDRDFRLHQWGLGYFYKLYLDVGNTLPFYMDNSYLYGSAYFKNKPEDDIQTPSGVAVFNGENHIFKIIVQDFWDNQSEVSGELVVKQPDFANFSLDNEYFNYPSFLNFYNFTDSLFYNIKKEFYDNYIRIEFEPIDSIQGDSFFSYQFVNQDIQRLPVIRKDDKLVGCVPLSAAMNAPLKLFIENYYNGYLSKQIEDIEFETIPPKRSKTIMSKDKLCKIEFSSNSLFKPIFLRISEEIPDSQNTYKFVSIIYDVEPKDVALNKGALIKLKYENKALSDKMGVYYKSKNGKWVFFGNIHDKENQYIAGYVGTFGKHALIIDDEPPEILHLYPANNAHIHTNSPQLKAVFKDTLSGLQGEDNMQLILDGKKVIAEYDPERLFLVYNVRQPLTKGKHILELFLKDKCGNIATQKHIFWID